MYDIQEETLNSIYRIKLYMANGYYNIKVTKIRSYPRGNYRKDGTYRGPAKWVAYDASESIIEALLKYAKLRQVWRHCYSQYVKAN